MLHNEGNTAPKDASGRDAALGAPGVWLERTGLRGPARASPRRGEGHRLERHCARPRGPKESQSRGAPPPHPPALLKCAVCTGFWGLSDLNKDGGLRSVLDTKKVSNVWCIACCLTQ